MDPGIGASGALRQNGLPGNAADGLGQRPLDGREAGLNLPAMEGG